MNANMITLVRNVPDYATPAHFVVARPCDGELWFWGAYKTQERAMEVALDVEGIVLHMEG